MVVSSAYPPLGMRPGGLSSTADTDKSSIFWLTGVISIGPSPLQQPQLCAALRRVQATLSPLRPTVGELIVARSIVPGQWTLLLF
jgi:hypothetical protein